MTEIELRKLLKNPQHTNHILMKFKEYLHSPSVKNKLLNKMLAKAKAAKKYNTLDFVKWFIEDYKYLVEDTPYGNNEYTRDMFLKMVWEASYLSIELVNNIRNNIILPE
jgi:hypothetical protein